RRSVSQIEVSGAIHLDLDGTTLLGRIRIAGVVTQNVVVARFGVDPLQRLIEVVRIDDGDAAGLLGQHPQAVLRFTNVILPLHLIDLLVEIGAADETARIDRVQRGVRTVGFARELGKLRRQIGERELLRLTVGVERVHVAGAAAAVAAVGITAVGLSRYSLITGHALPRRAGPLPRRGVRIEVVAVAQVDERLAPV